MLSMRLITRESSEYYEDVFGIFRETASYMELIEARLPNQQDVEDFFVGLRPGKDLTEKSTFGFFIESEMVGCAETMRGYPAPDSVWIGLLLITQPHQGKGLGKKALALLIETMSGWGYLQVQLGVVATNLAGYSFWSKNGFRELRRVVNHRFIGAMIIMERSIGLPG
jgi:GNAT superfamily N-acetyltransferase